MVFLSPVPNLNSMAKSHLNLLVRLPGSANALKLASGLHLLKDFFGNTNIHTDKKIIVAALRFTALYPSEPSVAGQSTRAPRAAPSHGADVTSLRGCRVCCRSAPQLLPQGAGAPWCTVGRAPIAAACRTTPRGGLSNDRSKFGIAETRNIADSEMRDL